MDIPYIFTKDLNKKIYGSVYLCEENYSTFNVKPTGPIFNSINLFLRSNKSKYFSKEEIKLIYELISSEDRDNYMIAYSIITNREEK